jgi:DNA-binding transcriptional regulator/RsmH inhibitor MraZ
MLTGSNIYNSDRKGRVVVPVPFRRALGTPLILTRAPEHALLALSQGQWETLCARHGSEPAFRAAHVATARECPVDPTTGRILIPRALREWAEVRQLDEVAVIGVGRAVLLTRAARWKAWLAEGVIAPLGPLEADLTLPDPWAGRSYSQTLRRPAGVPVLRCAGRVDRRAAWRLGETLRKLCAEGGPAVLLDVRETEDPFRSVERALLAARGGPEVLVIGGPPEVERFPTLEAAFLARPEGRVGQPRAAGAGSGETGA